MTQNTFAEYVGKYINRVLWSDVYPVGRIIDSKGKTLVLIQPIVASDNLVKMEYVPGGFAGHCINQNQQAYEFIEQGEPYWTRMSKTKMKKKFWEISKGPRKHYDYNF